MMDKVASEVEMPLNRATNVLWVGFSDKVDTLSRPEMGTLLTSVVARKILYKGFTGVVWI